MLSKINNKS